jgi:hypothetical protein
VEEAIVKNLTKSDQKKITGFINKNIKQNNYLSEQLNEGTSKFADLDYVNFEDLSSIF